LLLQARKPQIDNTRNLKGGGATDFGRSGFNGFSEGYGMRRSRFVPTQQFDELTNYKERTRKCGGKLHSIDVTDLRLRNADVDIVEALLNESLDEVREARRIDAIGVGDQHNRLGLVEFNRLQGLGGLLLLRIGVRIGIAFAAVKHFLQIGDKSRGHHLATTSLLTDSVAEKKKIEKEKP